MKMPAAMVELLSLPQGCQVRRLLGLIAAVHGSVRLLGMSAASLTWGGTLPFGLLLLIGGLGVWATARWRLRWLGRGWAVLLLATWLSFASAVMPASAVSGCVSLLYAICLLREAGTSYDG
jgi:hypothetical protein